MYIKFLIRKIDLNENDRSYSVFAANLQSNYVSTLLGFFSQSAFTAVRFYQQVLFDFYC